MPSEWVAIAAVYMKRQLCDYSLTLQRNQPCCRTDRPYNALGETYTLKRPTRDLENVLCRPEAAEYVRDGPHYPRDRQADCLILHPLDPVNIWNRERTVAKDANVLMLVGHLPWTVYNHGTTALDAVEHVHGLEQAQHSFLPNLGYHIMSLTKLQVIFCVNKLPNI